jgi:hypothetical protein
MLIRGFGVYIMPCPIKLSDANKSFGVYIMPCPIKLSDANKSFGVYIMPCPIKFIVTKEHFVDQVKKVCYN